MYLAKSAGFLLWMPSAPFELEVSAPTLALASVPRRCRGGALGVMSSGGVVLFLLLLTVLEVLGAF